MANVLGENMKSLRDIASMAYDTEDGTGAQGGEGRIGMIGGRVVKYNTHLNERLFGTRKSQEMIDGANALRNELVRIAADKFGAGDEAVVRIKQLLGWNGGAEPKSLLDRKIVAQVVSRLLDDNENWEGVFRAAHLDLKLEDSAANMDFAVQKLRVMRAVTGFKDLSYQGLRLIEQNLGEPSKDFLAVLNHATSFTAVTASANLSEKECAVLGVLMQNQDVCGANPSNGENRKALLALGRDLPFTKEVEKVCLGAWSEALCSERIPVEDRKSVLHLLRCLKAGVLDKGADVFKTTSVMTAFVAMLPNGIKRAREIQPKGEIKFETWWEALRLDSIADCPSKDDRKIGKKLLNAAAKRMLVDFRGTGLLSERDEKRLMENPCGPGAPFPGAFDLFLKSGELATYEACLRHLKHPSLNLDESEQYGCVPVIGGGWKSAIDRLPESARDAMRSTRLLGTTYKFGDGEFVNGPGADPDVFLNRPDGLRANFTAEQIYAMAHAINATEALIPKIYGGMGNEASLQVEITKANEDGDMHVIYKMPLILTGGVRPEDAKTDVVHEVVFKPDGSAKFVSLKCVDRNPFSPEKTLENISARRVAAKRYDDQRDIFLFDACYDIMQIYKRVGKVKDNDSSTYVDRLRLGVEEDVRELMEFLSTKPLDDAQLDEWSEDDVKELKALYKIMKKRWEITVEASKVNANQSYLDRCEDELVELRRAYENLEQVKFERCWKGLGCENLTDLHAKFKELFKDHSELGQLRCRMVNQMLSSLVEEDKVAKYWVPGNTKYRMEEFLGDLYEAVLNAEADEDGKLPEDLIQAATFMVRGGEYPRAPRNVLTWKDATDLLEGDYKVDPNN